MAADPAPNIEAAAEASPGVWQIPNICTSSLNIVRSREIPRYHQHAQGRRATAKLGLLQGGEGSAPVRLRADASILRQPQAVALSVLDQGCWKVPMAFTHDKDLGVARRSLASAAILSPGVSKQHVQYGANHGLLTTSNLTLVRDHAWVSKSIFTSCIMVAANPSRRPTLVQSSRHSSSDAKKTYRSCNLILKAVIWCQTCSRSRNSPILHQTTKKLRP